MQASSKDRRTIDTVGLERELHAITPSGVRFDAQARSVFASDASNYRIPPLGVVFPRSADEVAVVVATCTSFGASVVPRGTGTSIAGNAIGPGVIVDCSRHLDAIVDIDPGAASAVVEPGLVLDDLQRAAAPHGLRFGPDPSTHNRCTLGGMIGNNACGSRALRYGKTDVNVAALDVVTASGARLALGRLGSTGGDAVAAAGIDEVLGALVARYGDVIRAATARSFNRRVSGYGLAALLPEHGGDLARAFVGSEGTCGVVVGATLRLAPTPAATALAVVGFTDIFDAADAAQAFASSSPIAIEGMDGRIVDLASRTRRATIDLPPGGAFLLVEVDGETVDDAVARAGALARAQVGDTDRHVVLTGPGAAEAWRLREDGAGFASRLADGGEAWSGFEDAAVPTEHLGEYLRAFQRLLDEHGRQGIPYGHFGDGCVHVRIDFDLLTDAGVAGYRRFLESAADLVVSYGGSLSGEHGDGQARSELLPKMYRPEMMAAFGAFKAAFDPTGVMNPGRIVDPRPLDHDLRVRALAGDGRQRRSLVLSDGGDDLASGPRRCIGVGRCVRLDGGAMCPSFQVTRDEQHSTRGRARLLSEMIGGALTDSAGSDAVGDALDLCLGCKACRIECPVGVDMARYRVEFLARAFRHRIRPRAHYAFGFLPVALRIAGRFPTLTNRVITSTRLGPWLRKIGGIDPAAPLPTILRRPPTRRSKVVAGPDDIVLFGDCFSDHADPDVADAARTVLDHLGIARRESTAGLCCGLTWYSTGQVQIARRVLRRTVRALRRNGTGPIAVLEPSCAAMIRDDGASLLGRSIDDVAHRVVSFGQLVAGHDAIVPTGEPEPVIAQIHCHAYASGEYRAELDGVAAIGGSVVAVETACCGLAGNFGLEAGHHEIADAIYDRHLGATLGGLPGSPTVLADGFSCRTQIAAHGGAPRHFAQLLRDALVRDSHPGDGSRSRG